MSKSERLTFDSPSVAIARRLVDAVTNMSAQEIADMFVKHKMVAEGGRLFRSANGAQKGPLIRCCGIGIILLDLLGPPKKPGQRQSCISAFDAATRLSEGVKAFVLGFDDPDPGPPLNAGLNIIEMFNKGKQVMLLTKGETYEC